MALSFTELLQAAVTPIVLISGVGLILLSLINRFSHATTRTRALLAERRACEGARREVLSREIAVLLRRCRILRWSVTFIVISTVLSSLIVVGSVLSAAAKVDSTIFLTAALVGSCLCIVLANLLLLADVTLSLRALDIESSCDP